MLIWSATESTVTIMCSSIPALRPLYVRCRYGSKGDSSSGGQNSSSYKLPMYGNHGARAYELGSQPDVGAGAKVHPSHRTVITFNADNASDESILRDTIIRSDNGAPINGRIRRTDEVEVSDGAGHDQ